MRYVKSTKFFFIGDEEVGSPRQANLAAWPSEMPATPVVLHCFRARDGSGAEVPLNPDLVFAEACLGFYASGGHQVEIVENPLPEASFFGELPGGFVDSRPVPARLLVQLLRAQRLSSTAADDGTGIEDKLACEEAWAARVEATLAPLVELVLWGHGPCYRRHARPSVLRGTCPAGLPMALLSCWRRRRRTRAAYGPSGVKAALAQKAQETQALLDVMVSRQEESSSRFNTPRLDELIFLAYARPLLAIPEALLPFSSTLRTSLQSQAERISARLAGMPASSPTTPLRWSGCGDEQAQDAVDGTKALDAEFDDKLFGLPSSDHGLSRVKGREAKPVKLSQMWSAISVALSWPLGASTSQQDEAAEGDHQYPAMAANQRRGNIIFGVWILSSSAAFVAWSLRSSRRSE
eukprot:TRINITY_DN64007_c0_g1_i1.p1 TRINITY_DN64007_c0_g1~~TRINITY_DN64007_c0_g1_i1.p1  ORF type:complete len:407 (+),score=83.73 TRINITY_DN64007_c0_g1_i1:37-1257(+)